MNNFSLGFLASLFAIFLEGCGGVGPQGAQGPQGPQGPEGKSAAVRVFTYFEQPNTPINCAVCLGADGPTVVAKKEIELTEAAILETTASVVVNANGQGKGSCSLMLRGAPVSSEANGNYGLFSQHFSTATGTFSTQSLLLHAITVKSITAKKYSVEVWCGKDPDSTDTDIRATKVSMDIVALRPAE